MIIGDNRAAVIENIRKSAEKEEFYNKVELNDPELTDEEINNITQNYLSKRKTFSFRFKSFLARKAANVLTAYINKTTEIIGLEKLLSVSGGAVITSNHFSPTENTVIRLLAKKAGKKRINIVSQATNLAMPGILGFLMNYADVIPLSGDPHYMQRDFVSVLEQLFKRKEFVLIYPEQEMWFNYKKPRPGKRGAYYYAAKLNVPVISCFVEMKELEEKDTDEFYKIKFVLHVLDVISPDPEKSVRDNSIEMCEKDNELKREAYEKIYNKKLSYNFDNSDIAGWICPPNGGKSDES